MPQELRRSVPAVDLRAWLAAVGEIAREANSAASIQALVRRVTEKACQLMGYDFSLILLADRNRERLIVEGGYGLSVEYIARYNAERPVLIGPGPLGEGPSSQAFRTGRSVSVPDIRSEPIFGPWDGVPPPFEPPYLAVLSVPLITRDNVIGVLNCYTANPREFSAEETALVEILADQAAIAFEAAELRARERATIADLEHQRELLERAQEIHTDLTRVVLANEGLPGIAKALCGLLGCSISIEDAAAQPLAACSGREASIELTPDSVRAAPEVACQLAEQELGRQVLELGRPGEGFFWVAPVVVGQELVARVWAGPVEGLPGLLERRALEHGATVAALELLKQRAAQEVEWRLRGALLDDVLSSSVSDQQELLARARRLGHDLSKAQAVLVVRPDAETADLEPTIARSRDRGSARPMLEVVSRAVGRLVGPTALVAGHRDLVVVLWPMSERSDDSGVGEVAQQILRSARWAGQTVSIAVGPRAERTGDISGCYRTARGALNLAQRAGRRDHIIMLDRLDVYGLLLQVERPEALERFARNLLEPLEAYDRRRHAELVASLRAYLDHGLSVGAAASALVVHPHTLGYRLRRIEQLLTLSLRDPESVLRVQLAFMIQDVIRP